MKNAYELGLIYIYMYIYLYTQLHNIHYMHIKLC